MCECSNLGYIKLSHEHLPLPCSDYIKKCARFLFVKNKAYDKRFPNIVILFPLDFATDNGFLLTAA